MFALKSNRAATALVRRYTIAAIVVAWTVVAGTAFHAMPVVAAKAAKNNFEQGFLMDSHTNQKLRDLNALVELSSNNALPESLKCKHIQSNLTQTDLKMFKRRLQALPVGGKALFAPPII
jgi:hypothetical protein